MQYILMDIAIHFHVHVYVCNSYSMKGKKMISHKWKTSEIASQVEILIIFRTDYGAKSYRGLGSVVFKLLI